VIDSAGNTVNPVVVMVTDTESNAESTRFNVTVQKQNVNARNIAASNLRAVSSIVIVRVGLNNNPKYKYVNNALLSHWTQGKGKLIDAKTYNDVGSHFSETLTAVCPEETTTTKTVSPIKTASEPPREQTEPKSPMLPPEKTAQDPDESQVTETTAVKTTDPIATDSATQTPSPKGGTSEFILLAAIGGGVLCCFVVLCCLFACGKTKKTKEDEEKNDMEQAFAHRDVKVNGSNLSPSSSPSSSPGRSQTQEGATRTGKAARSNLAKSTRESSRPRGTRQMGERGVANPRDTVPARMKTSRLRDADMLLE